MPWAELSINGLLAGIAAIILGIVVIVFPRILNYAIGAITILFGILWIAGGSWLPGAVSIVFGILIIVFPAIWNYLVAAYFILWGLWLILGVDAIIAGIIALVCGVVVLVFPAILNYIFGIYLIVIGLMAIAGHYGWFGDTRFMLLPLIKLSLGRSRSHFIKPLPPAATDS